MTDNETKYWAFLSYSHQDNHELRSDSPDVSRRCWGNWLHDALMTFSIPAEFAGKINGRGEIIPERIDPIFRDESELPETATLSADIRKALEQSICLIVVCSPHSVHSHQVNEAVRYFKQLGRGQHILPIVVAGEPYASAGNLPGSLLENECFVAALRHPVSPDGTLDTTRRAGKSIFVDARHGVEKREILANDHRHAEADLEMAKIQLIALLLGVGFNGLWRREQKRHFFDFAEAQHQVREALNQVEEAKRQTREAQNQALETNNLPGDVHGQIQEAQNQAREAQKQLQEFQYKVRETQTQLEAARNRAIAAESKVLEAQRQAREAQNQLEETRNQFLEGQNTHEETCQQTQDRHGILLEWRSRVQQFQEQTWIAQSQLEAARAQAREAQSQVSEAQNQARAARCKVQEIQKKGRNARRLTMVFALLAVLALLAASMAWWQRRDASQALAKATAEAAGKFDLAQDGLDQEQVRQVLQKIGGAEQDGNRRRSLDELAAGIPSVEIPEAVKASGVVLNDQQRSHFQKWLLVRQGWVNPGSAMACASAIDGKIVNDEGLVDSALYFQLAVLDNWMKTDLPGAFSWVRQLPDADSRQRALKKIIHDPMRAIQLRQQIAAMSAGDDQKSALQDLLACWAPADPETTVNWLCSFPATNSQLEQVQFVIQAWSHREPAVVAQWLANLPAGTASEGMVSAFLEGAVEKYPVFAWRWTQSVTDAPLRQKFQRQVARQWMKTDPSTAVEWVNRLDLPPAIMQPRQSPWAWTKFLQNSSFGSLTIFPVETEILSNATNGPIQIQPKG